MHARRCSGQSPDLELQSATTGAASLRASTVFNQNLINGNYLGVANSLLTGTSTTWTGFVSSPALGVTPTGRLIRNGCDRIATSGQTTFNGIPLRCFPENYLNPNPQLGTTNAFYRTNSGSSNYHSMQAQITVRPTNGFSVQSTYTWSKTLQLYADDGSNPLKSTAGLRSAIQFRVARLAEQRHDGVTHWAE